MYNIGEDFPSKIAVSSFLALMVCTPAMAESVIVVSLAGEGYDGPPSFSLLIDDEVVGSGTLQKAIRTEADGRLFTKPRPSSFLEEFSFTVADRLLSEKAEIGLVLTNDKFTRKDGLGEDGVLDRNLFIDFVRVNDLEITSADMVLIHDGNVVEYSYQAGLLPIYEAGFRAVARAPTGGWPQPLAENGTAEIGMVQVMLPLPRPNVLLAADRAVSP